MKKEKVGQMEQEGGRGDWENERERMGEERREKNGRKRKQGGR